MTERRTPLYDFHFRTARNVVKGGGGFMFPTAYASPVEEHLNVRRNVGMQDLSTMGEVDIKGPGAERLVRRLLVNEVKDMEPGQLRYSTMCNERGGVVDDRLRVPLAQQRLQLGGEGLAGRKAVAGGQAVAERQDVGVGHRGGYG